MPRSPGAASEYRDRMRRRRGLGSRSLLGGLQAVRADQVGGRGLPPEGAARWRPWTVWPAIAVTFATALVGRALVREGGDPRASVVVGMIVLNLLGVSIAVLFAAVHGKPSAADFGLRGPRLARSAALTLAVGFGVFVFAAVWAGALGLEDDGPSITDRLAAEDRTSQALLTLGMVAIAAPLGEEFVFRGYVFRALSNWRGTLPAAVLSSIAFAATHVGWLPVGMLVPVAAFGFALCLLYHRTGSYPPLALHALWNALPTATAVGWSWQIPLAMAVSVLGTLVVAWLVASLLGDRAVPD